MPRPLRPPGGESSLTDQVKWSKDALKVAIRQELFFGMLLIRLDTLRFKIGQQIGQMTNSIFLFRRCVFM